MWKTRCHFAELTPGRDWVFGGDEEAGRNTANGDSTAEITELFNPDGHRSSESRDTSRRRVPWYFMHVRNVER